jgi:hypothetical protein
VSFDPLTHLFDIQRIMPSVRRRTLIGRPEVALWGLTHTPDMSVGDPHLRRIKKNKNNFIA